MKKLLAISLLFIYALSATGASLNLHYCCGMAQKLVINDQPLDHENCPMCSKKHKHENKCAADTCSLPSETEGCKNVNVDIKDATNEHISSNDETSFLAPYPAEVILYWVFNFMNLPLSERTSFSTDSSPPLFAPAPLFILNCTYRI